MRDVKAGPVPGARHAVLVGAQKAGTTYLHNLLVENAGCQGAFVKEPHYFTSSRRRHASYVEMFPSPAEGRVLLDSSVSYLHNPACAEEIASCLGRHTPILAMIREPVGRIVSAYQHSVKHGRDVRSLNEVLSLDGVTYEELFEEETERARAAHRRGKIAFRKSSSAPSASGDRHFGDNCYDDPYWNFRYVSNTMYRSQLEPFRQAFSTLIVVPFSDLTSDPRGSLDHVAFGLGIPASATFRDVQVRNKTGINRRTVLKKYVRNAAADIRSVDRPLNIVAGLYGATFLLPSSPAVPETVMSSGWFGAVRTSYEQAREISRLGQELTAS